MRKTSGFTLIELIVVIALIIILSAIAIPNYIAWLPKYRLNSAVDDVFVTLQQARLQAIRENAPVVVTFNAGTGRYTVFVDNGLTDAATDTFDTALRGNGTRDGEEPVVRRMRVPEGVTLDEVTYAGGQISYNSRGLGESGHVYMSNNRGGFKGVVTSMTGSIRTSRSDDGSTWD
jgi:prepilin-type N-terminal cleavage/methylation domain-containing protein